jgi:hypothetical protein
MITNRYKYFRWTKRTAGITFMYVVVVPSIIGYLGYKTDVSSSSDLVRCWWDMSGFATGGCG